MWDPSLSVVSQLEPVATSADSDKKTEKNPDKWAFIDEVRSSWVGTTDANYRHTFGDPSKTIENDHHALEAEATALVCCTYDWNLKHLHEAATGALRNIDCYTRKQRVEGVEFVA